MLCSTSAWPCCWLLALLFGAYCCSRPVANVLLQSLMYCCRTWQRFVSFLQHVSYRSCSQTFCSAMLALVGRHHWAGVSCTAVVDPVTADTLYHLPRRAAMCCSIIGRRGVRRTTWPSWPAVHQEQELLCCTQLAHGHMGMWLQHVGADSPCTSQPAWRLLLPLASGMHAGRWSRLHACMHTSTSSRVVPEHATLGFYGVQRIVWSACLAQ